MYRTIDQLTEDELEELRLVLYYELLEQDAYIDEVTDQMLEHHFRGVSFVEEDFFCNL